MVAKSKRRYRRKTTSKRTPKRSPVKSKRSRRRTYKKKSRTYRRTSRSPVKISSQQMASIIARSTRSVLRKLGKPRVTRPPKKFLNVGPRSNRLRRSDLGLIPPPKPLAIEDVFYDAIEDDVKPDIRKLPPPPPEPLIRKRRLGRSALGLRPPPPPLMIDYDEFA